MIFSVDNVVEKNLPNVHNKPWLAVPTRAMLRYLLHEKQCNDMANEHAHLSGVDFVEQILACLNFSYSVPNNEIENIPIEGRVVIYANHPIGSLDALALIKLISQVRPDIKVVANELLMAIKPLHSILLPVRNMTGGTPKQHLNEIHHHLNNEGAVLIFPSGEVSRLRPTGVTDLHWHSGFLKMARACNAPLLPIFVDAKNSATFYGASMIYKPLATLLLVKEMFKQMDHVMPVRIGQLIAKEVVGSQDFPLKTKVKLLKNHLYRIGKNRSPLFITQNAIAHPEKRSELQQALQQCELLGQTQDNKQIYLYKHSQSSAIMREIGRLREIAFRAVGEGTGKRRDTDKYDNHYYHLVLWDKDELEIVGSYRFASAKMLHETIGKNSLYSQSLFEYHDAFAPYFDQGLELGRSFVQPKYWGRRSLEYLWQGIGAFLINNPQYRFLFGPVSLSDNLPVQAKEMLVFFYKHQFATQDVLARSFNSYQFTDERQHQLHQLFNGSDYAENFKILKRTLANMAVSVPTLFKQYGELCDNQGVQFLDFGIDAEFGDCIDGLVLVDIHQLKPIKYQKYLAGHLPENKIAS
ncbi:MULTISPECIES: lysophospholipid acyltransferase family protein [Shewanella]|uniref:lysophospholipid acyltransferase family protein n=1 Tax=Shewanella TaxID=22 RepID=UPI000C62B09B|nr:MULTISPECIES: lysophospholipid acyltransferase family protein [Shewanella]NCQ43656.1 GNAT family N-acetyltransferase [Shewanella frigidimarina]NCO70030.1 GNAT family N-acetyltransferase [Shewanella vesiculosa]NCP35570.1 GNAT family N-acetyltransferase [Shewanella vesiculosa]NCP68151.1 GNAT family N-acetyltransferase [Shewanella vesiculosa]NCP72889.1 GNAT family N-acetyltransferase [Shewanella vesiculosa]